MGRAKNRFTMPGFNAGAGTGSSVAKNPLLYTPPTVFEDEDGRPPPPSAAPTALPRGSAERDRSSAPARGGVVVVCGDAR